tara:strand:+ start:839 stop:1039 length:201 start_codon:yes stop_codon:yes gene_type:complete
MIVKETQYLDSYVKIVKILDKVTCLDDKQINELKRCLVAIAFYNNSLQSDVDHKKAESLLYEDFDI